MKIIIYFFFLIIFIKKAATRYISLSLDIICALIVGSTAFMSVMSKHLNYT